MSRHVLPRTGDTDLTTVIVGWDNPLETFWLQIFDLTKPHDDQCVVWLGTHPEELPTVQALELVCMEYGVVIPEETCRQLYRDWQPRTAPTQLQRWALAHLR